MSTISTKYGYDGEKALEPLVCGIGRENPVICHSLGLCSALAVTGFVDTTLVMGAALIFVASLSSLAVSLMRNFIPPRVRLISQMLVISTLVILVHLLLQAHWFDMSKALGPYVGLIITNCIILARCEACALRSRPVHSFLDATGSAIGYAAVLLAISLMREPLGSGTLLRYPLMPESFAHVRIVAAAPGAFLAMGVIVWLVRAIWPESLPPEYREAR